VSKRLHVIAGLVAIACVQALCASPALAATQCPSTGSYAQAVRGTSGLAGYWRLDDPAGSTTVCDALGANVGSYRGGVQTGAAGALAGDPDTAATFDGLSGEVAVPDAAALDLGDAFTVEAWVKRGSTGGSENQAIVSKQNLSWVLMFNPANQLVLRKSNTGDVVASTVTLTDTTSWHHVAVTKSGSTVRLYIDGASVTGAATNRTMTDNTLPLAIGQSSDSAYFDGGIDEVAVYRGALTASQIQGHYAASTTTSPPPPPPPPPTDPVVAAAGDIACDPADASYNSGYGTTTKCRQGYVAGLLDNTLAGILALGDNQYEAGTLSTFGQVYGPTWGQFSAITHPIAGNHEYNTSAATGYFDYFNGAGRSTGPAGKRGAGWYSYDIGSWHLIALNSNCDDVGGCGSGSAQDSWLRSDLSAHTNKCTLAYWHHPRWTSGGEGGGNSTFMSQLYKDLYNANADLLLVGHDHDYERFAPQDPNAVVNQSRGIREFVVGSGGKSHHGWGTLARNSEVRNNATFGVLRLVLKPAGYDFRFVPEQGASFTDAGSGTCH
jgi:hypothetical protein